MRSLQLLTSCCKVFDLTKDEVVIPWVPISPGPPAPRPTTGFAQPVGYGGAKHASRNPAFAPQGERGLWIESVLDHGGDIPRPGDIAGESRSGFIAHLALLA